MTMMIMCLSNNDYQIAHQERTINLTSTTIIDFQLRIPNTVARLI